MPERTFASLVPRVTTNAPGCSHPLAVQYIRDAARRVCERTLAWRYQVPLFDLMPGVPEYFFNKPTTTDVHAVFSASVNGSPLDVLTLEQAIRAYPKWADQYNGMSAQELWAQAEAPHTFNEDQFNEALLNQNATFALPAAAVDGGSDPRSITQVTPDKFVLLPMPDASKTYRVRMFVALKPKRTATGMDEAALDDLEDVIVHGALQHLLVLPNVGWSDKELASYHAKQYLSQVTERRARANLTNARGQMRVQYQPI
jgi:hypothetical protein